MTTIVHTQSSKIPIGGTITPHIPPWVRSKVDSRAVGLGTAVRNAWESGRGVVLNPTVLWYSLLQYVSIFYGTDYPGFYDLVTSPFPSLGDVGSLMLSALEKPLEELIYNGVLTGVGIPFITFEGTADDWLMLSSKIFHIRTLCEISSQSISEAAYTALRIARTLQQEAETDDSLIETCVTRDGKHGWIFSFSPYCVCMATKATMIAMDVKDNVIVPYLLST